MFNVFPRHSDTHRWIIGSVIGVAVVLAVTSFLISQGKSTQTNAAYKPTPYPGKPLLPLTYKPPSSPAPATVACSKSTLKLYAMWPGAYQNYATESIELSNTSSSPCFLAGALPMSVTLTNGSSEPVSLKSFSSTRIDLQSSQVVVLIFGSPGECNPLIHKPVSSVTLGSSSGNMTISGLKLDVGCGQPTLIQFFAPSYPMSPPPTYPVSAQPPPPKVG